MTINKIIQKHYEQFYKMLPYPNKEIYDGLTMEDIFHNVLVTAINKFENSEIEEKEGFEYVKKTLLMEILFSKKRIKSNIVSLDTVDCNNIADN